jgi:hypothetical protein
MSTIKTIGIISLIVVAFVVIGVAGWGLQAAFLGPKTVTTQISSAGDVIEKTYDADNAIYNYEWFKQQHADIQAAEKMITNTKVIRDDYKDMYGDPKEWDWQTKQNYNSINTKYMGQINNYETLVEDYNARASMANRNVFQDKLPLHVDKILW